MTDKMLMGRLADVPLAQPGFDALGLAAPVILQANPQGQWQSGKPDKLDEERLKDVVQHLIKSKALSGANKYCCQCALENQNAGMSNTNYVPVIMMPIYPADQCPFDMECEIAKMKASEKPKRTTKNINEKAGSEDKDKSSIPKKRAFVMQRLTDFDLLSQW